MRCAHPPRLDLLLGEHFDNDGNEVGGSGTPAWAAAREPLWPFGNGGNGNGARVRVGAPADADLDYAWVMETFAGRRFALAPTRAGGDGAYAPAVLLHEDAGPRDALAGYYYATRAALLQRKSARAAPAVGDIGGACPAVDAIECRACIEAALDDGLEGDADGEDSFARWEAMLRGVAGWDTSRVLIEDEGWRWTALTFAAGAAGGDDDEDSDDEE